MKLRMKRKAMVVLAAGMLMSAAAPAAAMAAEKATGPALTASYNGDVNTLEAAKDATQLIVVIGNRQDPAKSRLDWYKRDADGKLVQVMSKEAVSGMNGITMQKQEGDKKTPTGVYRFTMAFGLKANPGTILPYHQIVDGDYYVDDGNSQYYNKLANTKQVQKDWNSVSIYGVLTGMALPFVLFPSAITNSLAVVLLPAVSEAQAQNQPDKIERTISMALRYSLYMGILCVGLFTRFGPALGETFYHNADAGRFIQILSWLCPFLYLSTTMGSILNGLGKTGTVFVHHTISMLLTLSLVLFAIPRWGIFAYLAALLISELVLAFLHIHALACEVPIRLPVSQGIVKPAFCLLVSIGMLEVIPNASYLPHLFPPVLIQSGILCLLYIGGLLLLHTGTVKQ